MPRETILIAAFSARALAQSARRAGFLPLVVDCFGDSDTVAAAYAARCLPARVQVGFIRRPLVEALDQLTVEAPSPPIGLVLGSGFECNPRLVSRLAERYRLIGNDAATIAAAKDPTALFGMLDRLGVPHPETQLVPPPAPAGWLMKRIGGSGGLHIHDCPRDPRPDPRRYFQKQIAGEPLSVAAVISPRSRSFAFTRQWVSPLPRRRFRYGGAAGPVTPDADLEARLIDACLAICREIPLRGLVSFDFLVAEGEQPALLEINPRPGATLDVLDDAAGTLFAAHVTASLGGDAAPAMSHDWQPPAARSAALLYADRGPLTVGETDWPPWCADRPQPGTAIAPRQPLVTVIADGADEADAERVARERLGQVERMLYEHKKGEHQKDLGSARQ